MSQILLKISAKQLDTDIKYIKPMQSYKINKQSKDSHIEKMNFLAKSLLKEVIPKKEGKKFVKIALRTIATSLSILTLVDPTFTLAATIAPSVLPVAANPDLITSMDIIKLCKYLLGICIVISFSIAIIMSVIASSLGYFRKSEKSFKWVTEIIKSFVMVMLAPTIIITIALVAYLLFGSSEWFISPLAGQ